MKYKKSQILIIDGQGGGVGSRLVKLLKPVLPDAYPLLCAGTNSLATNSMLKAGADQGATGENAVIFNARRAELILGPIGVIMANGILGEVSPAMAEAISGAAGKKILIPSSSCGAQVVGVENMRMEDLLQLAVEAVKQELSL